ncbi:MAG: aminotransferase class V-fold PLP-dependent enzyme, partial [Oscillospiraceae bacterium]|nr:aminotransferase class V-fold PLP-dependent enzyme [Oscillospiraceae bacterium]
PEQVVFTFNATHALNIAIRSLVRPGGRVLISGWEHNAVTRPLHALGAEQLTVDTPLFDPGAFLDRAEAMLGKADAVVCTHVSNVFGYVLPVEELAALCRTRRKPFIIDASQSAGALPLDFAALGAEFVAMPGHKGLMGPQGTGVLLCKNDARPLLYGGSGSESLRQDMPEFLPDRLEAGTHNVAGIAGLKAGVEYLLEKGTDAVRTRERELLERLAGLLSGTEGLRLFFSPDPEAQCAVLSVLPEHMSCEALGDALAEAGMAVRTGLHCAPLAHRTAGTAETGTLRFSLSPFNTHAQIDRAAEECKMILAGV